MKLSNLTRYGLKMPYWSPTFPIESSPTFYKITPANKVKPKLGYEGASS